MIQVSNPEGKNAEGAKPQLESLAFRCSVEAPNDTPKIPLPPQIPQIAEYDLLSLERRINGLWSPKVVAPIEIPKAPESKYYENYSKAFARSYFYKNLFKCLLTTQILRYHLGKISEITDIGAGTGVFSIALSTVSKVDNIQLVDRSSRQLEIAKRVFERLNLDSKVEYKITDFSQLDTLKQDILCSYALGESVMENVDIFRLVRRARTFTLIDSPYLISSIQPILKQMNLRIVSGSVEFSSGESISHLVEGGGGRFAYLHSSGPK